MSFVANNLGYYRKKQIGLVVDYNEELQIMECGILIVGFCEPMSVATAEELAEKLDFYITRGEKLGLRGIKSTFDRETPLVSFNGYYGDRCYGTTLQLAAPQMQLSLAMASKLLHDIRNCVEISLAVLKGVAKQNGFRINGSLIERVIDTADPRIQKEQRSLVIKNMHRLNRLECLSM